MHSSTAATLDRPRREFGTIGLVSAAHFMSHMLQVALAPVLPMMRDDFGVSFTELGIVLTLIFAASALFQAIAGVLVDRLGAHRLLLAGLTLQSVSIGAMALAPSYWVLLPLGIGAGLGNSVYHPADMTILSRRISPARMGRGFAIHSMGGSIGFGVSPLLVGIIAGATNWRVGVFTVGALGIAVALMLLFNRSTIDADADIQEVRKSDEPRPAAATFLHVLTRPVVLMSFAYMVATSFAGAGIQTFGIATLTSGYGETLIAATFAITSYQFGQAGGILLGGVFADRGKRHALIAGAGLAIAAVLTFAAAWMSLPSEVAIPLFAVIGCAVGVTAPSRDILVRRASPAGGLGKVFGLVYSGFDVGSLLAPLAYGLMLDNQAPTLVFATAAVIYLVAIGTVVGVRSRLPGPV